MIKESDACLEHAFSQFDVCTPCCWSEWFTSKLTSPLMIPPVCVLFFISLQVDGDGKLRYFEFVRIFATED